VWDGFGEKQERGPGNSGSGAEAIDGRVAKLHCDGRRGSTELRFVFFGKFQVNRAEIYATFQRLLLGFHLLDFAANARDLLFDFKNVFHLACARAENILKALLGFAGVSSGAREDQCAAG